MTCVTRSRKNLFIYTAKWDQLTEGLVLKMKHDHTTPTGRSKQTIVTSWNDITRISCAIEGGNYKRRAQLNLRAVIWVSWYKVFGSINKPQTLYFGYLSASLGAKHNQNGPCDLFIHIHVPRPFWGTLVSVTLVVWH